ncbi:MAG: DUF222 domain-containing protein [Gemmatimonadota bacterium]|jgi:hypothetical protein
MGIVDTKGTGSMQTARGARSAVDEGAPEAGPACEPASEPASEAPPQLASEAAPEPHPPEAGATESARFQRMERVSVLYGQITAATREFLRAVAECDRHRDWAEEGFACCADWLAWRIGIARGTAREKVRAARALEGLPQISEAMGRGEISFSKVRALTRVARPESEAELLAYARSTSTAGLERLVRGWKALDREDEQKLERVQHRLRRFSVYPDGSGSYEVRGKLTAEVAAVLMRAIEAASDALYREHRNEGGPARGAGGGRAVGDESAPAPEQLRADALGLLAERALAAGFGGDVPVSGSRAERTQVMLHVVPETLAESGEPGMSELEDGTRVSAETSRRMSCDASRVVVEKSADGEVLRVGRKTRTIPPALRRALEVRDRGCRFPGCGLRFTDGHHIVHWADGGRTDLDNTVLLCRRHHRLVHEEGHRICMDGEGRVVFFAPGGRPIAGAGRPATLGATPVADLIGQNRSRGAMPKWDTILPTRHYRSPIAWELEADACEALDRAAERPGPSNAGEAESPEAGGPEPAETHEGTPGTSPPRASEPRSAA